MRFGGLIFGRACLQGVGVGVGGYDNYMLRRCFA